MAYLRMRNWEKWQTYRKDRGQPPWIKVHRALMRDPNWIALTDAQRGQLVAMWMLAADKDGAIPASPAMIRKLCFMESEPDINLFKELGFIDGCQDGAKVTPERRQGDAPEKSRIEEIREETDIPPSAVPGGVVLVGERLPIEEPVYGPPEVPKAEPQKYAFESGVIRLNAKDLQKWEEAFTHLDVRAELIGLTQWAEREKNWFHAVAGALAKRNRDQRLKQQHGANKNDFRNPMAGIL